MTFSRDDKAVIQKGSKFKKLIGLSQLVHYGLMLKNGQSCWPHDKLRTKIQYPDLPATTIYICAHSVVHSVSNLGVTKITKKFLGANVLKALN